VDFNYLILMPVSATAYSEVTCSGSIAIFGIFYNITTEISWVTANFTPSSISWRRLEILFLIHIYNGLKFALREQN